MQSPGGKLDDQAAVDPRRSCQLQQAGLITHNMLCVMAHCKCMYVIR